MDQNAPFVNSSSFSLSSQHGRSIPPPPNMQHLIAPSNPNTQERGGLKIVKRASATPFLVKLWQMLETESNFPYISWNPTGDSFEVKSQKEMAKTVLPLHFRHSNFSSFQRQLNYFGFRKVGRGDQGCLYAHDMFRR
jgi:hypothetical protein